MSRPVTVAELGRVVWGRARVVAAGAAVGLLGVLGYLVLVPASYSATAVVVVRAVVTDPFTYPGAGADRAVNMNVESAVADSGAVVAKVAAATHRSTTDARAALAVAAPVGGQLLRFTYTGDSAGQAVRGANAAAHAYLSIRSDSYARQRTALLSSYDDDLAKVRTAQRTAKANQQAALTDQLTELTRERSQVAAIDTTAGELATAAGAPVAGSHDAAPLYLLVGLLGGALLGAAAAQAVEAADRRVRSAADAVAATGLPLVGTVRSGRGPDLRYLALTLLSGLEDAGAARRLVLLSARDGEGRLTLVERLAVTFALDGHEVRLGDAAGELGVLRARLLAAYPAVPDDEEGGAARWSATLGPPVARNPGTAPDTDDRAAQVISVGPGTVRLGDVAVRPGGVTLLDTPAAEGDESGVRAARAGGAVVVAALGRTRVSELTRLAGRLRAVGAEPLGVVLTGPDARSVGIG